MVNVLGLFDANQYLILIAILGIFIGGIMLNWVNKTIGLKFAFQLFKMKKKRNKDKILLKILVPNGKPEFKITKVAPLIEYPYKENGRDKKGMVIFDYYSITEMFNGIKVLECRPDDILPRNPYIDTSLTISGDLVKKNVVDSAKEDFSLDGYKKWIKIALPLVIAVGVIMILYSQNQAEQVAELTNKLIACYNSVPKEATIIAN